MKAIHWILITVLLSFSQLSGATEPFLESKSVAYKTLKELSKSAFILLDSTQDKTSAATATTNWTYLLWADKSDYGDSVYCFGVCNDQGGQYRFWNFYLTPTLIGEIDIKNQGYFLGKILINNGIMFIRQSPYSDNHYQDWLYNTAKRTDEKKFNDIPQYWREEEYYDK